MEEKRKERSKQRKKEDAGDEDERRKRRAAHVKKLEDLADYRRDEKQKTLEEVRFYDRIIFNSVFSRSLYEGNMFMHSCMYLDACKKLQREALVNLLSRSF